MMKDCLFCKIAAGEIPSVKIYESDSVLAFLDISPVEKGHTLVISKRAHSVGLLDTDPAILDEVLAVARKVAQGLLDIGFGGFNVVQNNFPAAGQSVPHLHVHVIPRKADGKEPLVWKSGAHPYASDSEREEFAKRLRDAIAKKA